MLRCAYCSKWVNEKLPFKESINDKIFCDLDCRTKYIHKFIRSKSPQEMKHIRLFKNPFPKEIKIAYHHINYVLTIPLPRKSHDFCKAKNIIEHKKKAKMIIKKIYLLDLDKILMPKS